MSERSYPVYKIILLGEKGVGKSALLDRIAFQRFIANSVSHPGIRVERVLHEGIKQAELIFWDYSPAQTIMDIPEAMLEGCNGYLFIIDNTTKSLSLRGKLRQVKRHLPGVPHVILQNKIDRPFFTVRKPKGVDLSVSAKTGEGVKEALSLLLDRMDS